MDDLVTLASKLKRFSYKPGSSFRIEVFGGRPAIAVRIETVNAYDPSKKLWLPGRKIISNRVLKMEERELQETLFTLVGEVEDHETREWFMYDGVRLYDPHQEG